jgi:hypothetical protein
MKDCKSPLISKIPNSVILYSNWETLTVKAESNTYKAGDIYYTNNKYWRYKLFNGLVIQSVSFNGFGGANLRFSQKDWHLAKNDITNYVY